MRLFVFVMYLQCISSQEIVYQCLPNPKKFVDVGCREGESLYINEVLYGYSKHCVYVSGGCREILPYTACNCATSCSIPVNRFYSTSCEAIVNYIRVVFTCDKASRTECERADQLPVPGKEQENTKRWQDDSLTSKPTTIQHRSEGVLIIVSCATAAAVLVLAIVTVIILLKRFSWVEEKYCLLRICAPICLNPSTDRDADGSENPDDPITAAQQPQNNSRAAQQQNQSSANNITASQNEYTSDEVSVSVPYKEEVSREVVREVKRLLTSSDNEAETSVAKSEASLYETLDQLITMAGSYSTMATLECRSDNGKTPVNKNMCNSASNPPDSKDNAASRLSDSNQAETDVQNNTVCTFEIVDGVGVSSV